MKIVKIFIVFFIFLGKVVLSQDFEVAPVSLEFDAEPAESQKRIMTITNHCNKKTSFKIEVKDFYKNIQGKKKYVAPNSIKLSCANWMNISPSFFEINPNESQVVAVTMMVPSNDYSTRWAMLYVQPTEEQTSINVDAKLGAGISVSGRIAVEITQSPKSNTKYHATITNFEEITQESDTARVYTAFINNTGDKILDCKIYLIASNMKTMEEFRFTPVNIRLYPQSSQKVTLNLPYTLIPGKYSLGAILDYGHRSRLEGVQMMIDVE